MSERYANTNIVINAKKIESDGTEKYVRRLQTIFYPNFSSIETTQIVSQEGDRLDLLAKEFYGNENLWFVIAKVNNLGKGTLNVPAGLIIKIPYYAEEAGIYSVLNDFNFGER